MNASPNLFHFSSKSNSSSPMNLLARQLQEAQRLERLLWSTEAEGGTDKLADTEATDAAWMRVRSLAESLLAQPAVGWQGREMRLAAAFLLALLSADDPEKVRDLQATARMLSDNDQVGRRDSIGRLLHLIATGRFVMSSADISESGVAEDEGELVLPL